MSELFSERDLFEAQTPEVLKAHRAKLLGKMSLIESRVFLINDVLGGMGAEDADPGAAYDADDGTPGSTEYPNDIRWNSGGWD